ncbi:hypothetical protein [Argonema antarcticum]|nr:hypothetical protein [Argonema antarcticum]
MPNARYARSHSLIYTRSHRISLKVALAQPAVGIRISINSR